MLHRASLCTAPALRVCRLPVHSRQHLARASGNGMSRELNVLGELPAHPVLHELAWYSLVIPSLVSTQARSCSPAGVAVGFNEMASAGSTVPCNSLACSGVLALTCATRSVPESDFGNHSVASEVTADFLEYTKAQGEAAACASDMLEGSAGPDLLPDMQATTLARPGHQASRASSLGTGACLLALFGHACMAGSA